VAAVTGRHQHAIANVRRRQYQRQAMLSRRRNLSRFGIAEDARVLSDVYVCSQKLGCHGIADMMPETATSLYLIEFKISEPKPVKGHIFQVAAYAIAAEQQFNKPIAGVFILYGDKGKTFEVQLSASLRRQVESTVTRVSSLLNGASMPDFPASAEQCGQCEYLNFCAGGRLEWLRKRKTPDAEAGAGVSHDFR